MKIDAFAHILPPRYFARVDEILASGRVAERIRGYHPWFREDPALTNLDAPRFEPLFEKMAALDRTIWVHPTRSDAWLDYPEEGRSRYGIWWSLGWPYETSVCMARLVYAGHLERHPDLKIVTHHAGAMVPHFSGRMASPIEGADRDEVAGRLPRPPIEYFRRFYTDSAMFGAPHAVRCASEF